MKSSFATISILSALLLAAVSLACGSVTGVSLDGGSDGKREASVAGEGGAGGTSVHPDGSAGVAGGSAGSSGGRSGGPGGAAGTAGAGGSASGPCAGVCSDPMEITTPTFSSGSIAPANTCYETTIDITGGSCDIVSGRALIVNGVTENCDGDPWPSLPAKVNAGYCFLAPAGDGAYTLSFKLE